MRVSTLTCPQGDDGCRVAEYQRHHPWWNVSHEPAIGHANEKRTGQCYPGLISSTLVLDCLDETILWDHALARKLSLELERDQGRTETVDSQFNAYCPGAGVHSDDSYRAVGRCGSGRLVVVCRHVSFTER